MLGNSKGPVINFKLKTLPLPFLVETPESTPDKRIFKFDCAVPDAQIKYEITNYLCPIDTSVEPTNLYTTNQTFTADRPKKIKLIASKDGYKTTNIQIINLTIKPYLDVGLRVGWPNETGTNAYQLTLGYLYINDVNYNYYINCSNNTSTGILSASFRLANSTAPANQWNNFIVNYQRAVNGSITLLYKPTSTSTETIFTFSKPLSVRISLPANPQAGYLEGGEMIFYVKPFYPRPTITQTFTGRPAIVTITKRYESNLATDTIAKQLIADSKLTGNIYYTLDGSTPTINSNLYTNPFPVTTNTVVKALVLDNDRNGTLAAAYINVGQIQYINNARATYTTSSNVSAITILRADGGVGDQIDCLRIGTTTYNNSQSIANNLMGMRYNGGDIPQPSCQVNSYTQTYPGKSGQCIISKIYINSTKTFYITAGADSQLITRQQGGYLYGLAYKSIIKDSNGNNLTGNIYTGLMDDLYVTRYMLSGMRLHQIITQPWVWDINNNNNILNILNYDLNSTINDIYLNSNIYHAMWYANPNNGKAAPRLISGPGVYIIEHYINQ